MRRPVKRRRSAGRALRQSPSSPARVWRGEAHLISDPSVTRLLRRLSTNPGRNCSDSPDALESVRESVGWPWVLALRLNLLESLDKLRRVMSPLRWFSLDVRDTGASFSIALSIEDALTIASSELLLLLVRLAESLSLWRKCLKRDSLLWSVMSEGW